MYATHWTIIVSGHRSAKVGCVFPTARFSIDLSYGNGWKNCLARNQCLGRDDQSTAFSTPPLAGYT